MIALIAVAAFSISSPAFPDGGNIPSKFTCDAGQTNPSPALAWKDAPANTKSFVLIMHDPDAPLAGGFTHWVLFDIPATTMSLPEGFQPGSVGVSGNSGFRRQGYGGPCPPSGSHHYHFILTALDVPALGLQAGAAKADVEKAMEGRGRQSRDDRSLPASAEAIGPIPPKPRALRSLLSNARRRSSARAATRSTSRRSPSRPSG